MFLTRAFRKIIWEPIKYRQIGERYWADRFSKYGKSLLGPGHDGKSEVENQKDYVQAQGEFQACLENAGIDLGGKSVLEIGVGLGNYTREIYGKKPSHLTGMDITDVNFASLGKELPDVNFVKHDIGKRLPFQTRFDVVICVDVIQHIPKHAFPTAVQNMWRSVAPGGTMICGPIDFQARKVRWHVTGYGLDTLLCCMDFELYPFRDSWLAVRRK